MPLTPDNHESNGSRVPFGIPRSTAGLANHWAHDALQLIASLPTVSVSLRADSCYIIRDLERAPIYIASMPFQDVCCGIEEDDVSFSVMTSMYEPLFRIQTFGDRFCRGVPYIEGYVKLHPDTELGMIEGDINTVFLLKTNSGDNFCSIELMENEGGVCSCSQRVYEVKPLSSPHDIGSITTDSDLYLILNFPRVFDVLRRTLLLSCVISMQYQIEADRRRSRSRTGI
ncbi:uncharacterized protein [Palaemon carinicauda]|uniref:uncharacterized protein n=1 Tax=Palaemon carinicauda TaxID=392227 RepID=UPI0035B5B78F